jgi:hypothetical protein
LRPTRAILPRQPTYGRLNRYEEITWFDSNGWMLAGYDRTYGQIQQKDSWEQFQLARGPGDEKNPVPDGCTAPFYKADRIAEYRRARATFSARLAAATTLQEPSQRREGDQ